MISLKDLSNWNRAGIAFLAAAPVLTVIIMVDLHITKLTGYGINDLQHAPSLDVAREIVGAWQNAGKEAASFIGFSCGLDYLFMPLYTSVFTFGAFAARDVFAPRPGMLRSILGILALSTVIAMFMDGVENPLQLQAVLGEHPIDLAHQITSVKWVLAYIGMTMTIVGGVATIIRRFTPSRKAA